jgi:hypothetical protein
VADVKRVLSPQMLEKATLEPWNVDPFMAKKFIYCQFAEGIPYKHFLTKISPTRVGDFPYRDMIFRSMVRITTALRSFVAKYLVTLHVRFLGVRNLEG